MITSTDIINGQCMSLTVKNTCIKGLCAFRHQTDMRLVIAKVDVSRHLGIGSCISAAVNYFCKILPVRQATEEVIPFSILLYTFVSLFGGVGIVVLAPIYSIVFVVGQYRFGISSYPLTPN